MIRRREQSRNRRPLPTGLALALCLPGWLACGSTSPPAPTDPPPAVAPPSAKPEVPLLPPRYAAAAGYSAEHAGLALLVVEDGEVVVEIGQNGADADAPRPLFSGTKSFWGVLAVAAAEDGLLDLDEPVALTLPEFGRHEWKSDMTIRQLLAFTSGLESGFVPLRRDAPASWYGRALTLEMIARPGERFQYGPSHLFVFGELLRRKLEPSGEDPLDYLTRRLFEPIGLDVSGWSRDAKGDPDLPSGAVLRPREWARFGALIRDRGRAREVQLVPERALSVCFRGSEVQPAYGLTFWLNSAQASDTADAEERDAPGLLPSVPIFYPDGLPDLVIAAGAANQRLYVSPEAGLVVVRFGERDRTWQDRSFLALISDAASEAGPPQIRGAEDQP